MEESGQHGAHAHFGEMSDVQYEAFGWSVALLVGVCVALAWWLARPVRPRRRQGWRQERRQERKTRPRRKLRR